MTQKIDKILILSIFLFLVLNVPFFGSIPHLDGNQEFIHTYNFFTGGFANYFENWNTVHPPFKLYIASFLYSLFGANRFTFSAIGIWLGILGIFSMYYLVKTISDKQTARISSILLATSPLFLSVGIFGMKDFILTVLVLASLYLYAKQKYFYYAIASSFAVLTKETGILLPIAVVISELLLSTSRAIRHRKLGKITKLLHLLLPFLATYLWVYFLKLNGKEVWGDWIFAETASRGAAYTILNNLITFKFLNKYAYQHWLQLTFLNFNWVFWFISIIGFGFISLKHRKKLVNKIFSETQIAKTYLAMFLFFSAYVVTVLTFQTFTIPRYTLPVIPFMLIATSLSLKNAVSKIKPLKFILLPAMGGVIFTSLFFSVDPLATKLWGKIDVMGQDIYALNKALSGNDGITYNLQYAIIVKRRTKQILGAHKEMRPINSDDCYWVFPDPNNELKTIKYLKLEGIILNPVCENF